MTTRRDLLGLAALAPLAPLLAACGGAKSGAAGTDNNRYNEVHRVIHTDIPADDWPSATPASVGIAPAAMTAFLESGKTSPFLRSLLVVRNGVLVGERYYNGSLSSDLLEIESVTKTVTSLLVGIALRDGKLASTSQTLGELLPRQMAKHPGAPAASVSLAQVLTMQSGLAWNETTQQSLLNATDLTEVALGLPALALPGSRWNYSSAVSHLLSPVLAERYGASLGAMASANLFTPLGIKQSYWVADSRGETIGSFGLHLRTRDLMKLGWMALQGGQWDGRSLVPQAWIRDSQVNVLSTPLLDDGPVSNRGYGRLWWTGTMAGRAVILACGFGGQYLVLVPSLQLVVATAAMTEGLSMGSADLQQRTILGLVSQFLGAL